MRHLKGPNGTGGRGAVAEYSRERNVQALAITPRMNLYEVDVFPTPMSVLDVP